MKPFANLVEALAFRINTSPDLTAFRFVSGIEAEKRELSFSQLGGAASHIAARLKGEGSLGARALLLCVPGLDAAIGLYGCFAAGVVAVPVAGAHPNKAASKAESLARIAADCDARFILASRPYFEKRSAFAAVDWRLGAIEWIEVDEFGEGCADFETAAHDIALLQYTSGSTSAPKGVILSHANIWANQILIEEVTERTLQPEWAVSWLPYYHDMGLSFLLQVPYLGATCTLMAPLHFMQKPMSWLDTISQYQAACTAVPAFAFDYTLKRFASAEAPELDLRSIRTLFVGAEPISARSLEKFSSTMQFYGLDERAICPSFGMAESTLMITHSPYEAPTIRHFCADSLARGTAVTSSAGSEEARFLPLVGNGSAGVEHHILIVDPETQTALSDGQVGEIWAAGPSIGQGYWGAAEATEATFHGTLSPDNGVRYLRTGDLGFCYDGHLFVVGRIKEMLIVQGRNVYPYDLEDTARATGPELANSAVAIFEHLLDDRPGIAVLIELRMRQDFDAAPLLNQIRHKITGMFDVDVNLIGFVGPLSLPRTTSGKIKRLACSELLCSNQLQLSAKLEITA